MKSRLLLLLIIAAGVTGCAGAGTVTSDAKEVLGNIYLHDPALEATAKAGSEKFHAAKSGELWKTMLQNLEKGVEVENEDYKRVRRAGFEAELHGLIGVQPLTWAAVQACGGGISCGQIDFPVLSTLDPKWTAEETGLVTSSLFSGTADERLAAVSAEIAGISSRIEALTEVIKDDPDGEKVTGPDPSSPSSTLNNMFATTRAAITDVDQKVKDTADEFWSDFVNARKQVRDAVMNPLKTLMPKDSYEAVADAVHDVASQLGDIVADVKGRKESILKLPETAKGRLTDALIAALDDSDLCREAASRGKIVGVSADDIEEKCEAVKDKLIEKTTLKLSDVVDSITKPVGRALSDSDIDDLIEGADGILERAENVITQLMSDDTPELEKLDKVIDLLRKGGLADTMKIGTLKELLEQASDVKLPVKAAARIPRLLGSGNEAKGKARLQAVIGKTNMVTVGDLIAFFGDDGRGMQAVLEAISIQNILAEIKGRKISTALKASLKTHTGQDVETIGDVLGYLEKDESKLHEIRLTFRRDWRKGVVARRALELRHLREQLRLTQTLMTSLKLQRKKERSIRFKTRDFVNMYPSVDFGSSVYGTLNGFAIKGDEAAYLAFQDGADIAANYFARIGYLADAEAFARIKLVQLAHKQSIEVSQTNAEAHEAMIERAVAALVTFTEGGVTSDDLAGVFRFLQTGLLAVITGAQLD